MKIETLTFFRTHLLIGGKRELFPVVNLVLDQPYPGLSETAGLSVQISTERTDYQNAPVVLLHVTLALKERLIIRKTKTIDYTDEDTVHFFEDIFSGDPFLVAFTDPVFLNGKSKEFQYTPASVDEEQGRLFRWDIELAYTDSTSQNLIPEKLNGLLSDWWEKEGKSLNSAQDTAVAGS